MFYLGLVPHNSSIKRKGDKSFVTGRFLSSSKKTFPDLES
jgi:hypothetical protein